MPRRSRTRTSSAPSARAATTSRATASYPTPGRATCSPSCAPAPTASRWPRTTTPAPARPRSSSGETGGPSSASARATPTSSKASWSRRSCRGSLGPAPAAVEQERREARATSSERGVHGERFGGGTQQDHQREQGHHHVYGQKLRRPEAAAEPEDALGEDDDDAQAYAAQGREVREEAQDQGYPQRQLPRAHELREELGVRNHSALHELPEERWRLRDEAPGLQAGGELPRKRRVQQLLQAAVEPYRPDQDAYPRHAVHRETPLRCFSILPILRIRTAAAAGLENRSPASCVCSCVDCGTVSSERREHRGQRHLAREVHPPRGGPGRRRRGGFGARRVRRRVR